MAFGLEAIISAATGAVFGFATNEFRTRGAARTAARLIHAELIENTACIRYYRQSDRLLEPGSRHVAWDNNSVALARMRGVRAFQIINSGYQALEAINFIAGASPSNEPVPPDLRDILEEAITRVVEALGKSGGLAGIQDEMLTGFLASLGPQTEHAVPQVAGGRAVLRGLGFVAPIVIFNLDSKQAAADAKQTAAATGPSPSGQAALQVAAGPTGARRLVLDAKGTDRWVGVTPVRREGESPTGDLAVDEAYDGLGLAYRFFKEVFGRDSIDGAGMELVAVVHYGTLYANAFWNGESFIFGDGDGAIFLRTTAGLDVIGHEYAFAILQFSVVFGSTGQAGSLWQSLADVFGVLTKQYKLHHTASEADWLIGHDIAGPKLGLALRSLKEPGSAHPGDTQPSHMDQFVDSVDDSEIHINSGILNHAFYLVAIAIEGYAWEKAGHIWYEALSDPAFSDPALNEDATFLTFAAATSRATRRLYGEATRELSAVTNAWAAVGIRVPADAKP